MHIQGVYTWNSPQRIKFDSDGLCVSKYNEMNYWKQQVLSSAYQNKSLDELIDSIYACKIDSKCSNFSSKGTSQTVATV